MNARRISVVIKRSDKNKSIAEEAWLDEYAKVGI
jgi:hypothetical protein